MQVQVTNGTITSLNALVFSLRFQFFWIILQPPAFHEVLGHDDYLESLELVSMRVGGWLMAGV